MSISVHPIKALSDNYIWCLHNDQYCVVVDPGEAEPVLAYCKALNLRLCGILITHHHWDHTNGLPELVETFTNIPIFGPTNPEIKHVSHRLTQGDKIHLAELDIKLKIMEVPGHTLDHIAFYNEDMLFCGDTLFSAGCGRLFEGTPSQMLASLTSLGSLSSQTKVYCTHEYTLSNIKFALTVEPMNQTLLQYEIWAKQQIKEGRATLPSAISNELAINPFLRCNSPEVISKVEANWQTRYTSKDQVFAALRRWKDQF